MKPRIFYGWWIVLSTSIICLLGFGTWLYSFGVFLKPMCAEFGWSRAMTAGAYSLRSIEGGVASPVVGWAVGAGLGGLVCAPAVAWLITHYGWRAAFVVLGATVWVVVIPLALVSIVGRLGLGYLGDYITKRYLFMVSYLLMGTGLFVLRQAGDMASIYLFVALFGVGFGGMVPLMPAIRTEYFGRKALGKIQGFMNPVMMLAGAAGPIVAGHLFDTTGTYRTSFLFTGLLMFVAVGVIFFARPARLHSLQSTR